MAKHRGTALAAPQRSLLTAEDRRVLLAPAPVVVMAAPPRGRQTPEVSLNRWTPYASYSELRLPQIVEIERAADRGQTELWADLTRRMLTDDHLASVWETRVDAVAGARFDLKPGASSPQDAGPYRSADLAQRARDDCWEMLERLPDFRRSIADILDGVATGWSVLEIIWELRGTRWCPVDLIWIHPRRFRFADNLEIVLYDDGLAYVNAPAEQKVSANGVSGMRLSPRKYIVHIPRVLPNYPVAGGILRAISRMWWAKLWCMRYWLAGAELGGNPRYWGKYPQEATPEAKDELFDMLEQLSGDGVAAFSKDVEVAAQQPLAQGVGSIWEALVKRADGGMSKTVLGSTLNVEVGDSGGNRALGESQGDITIVPRAQRDARSMWRTVERDLFAPFLYFNRHCYNGVVPPVPRGESYVVEQKPEIDQLLVDSGKVRVDELRTSRGLPPLGNDQGGDQFVVPVQPAGGGAPVPFSDRRASSRRPWDFAATMAARATRSSG